MPAGLQTAFQGNAQAFQDSLATVPLLILAALLAVYIILGVLYESFIHPLTILSTLPSAGFGALAILMLAGYEFSLIALIGVILLIGIVKKNGIMMVDFAIAVERDEHLSSAEAIRKAALMRFRPIMMTTMAAMLGGVPLMLSHGTGSELRQPLGYAMVGGLIVSQALTLFTTPVIYLYLDRLSVWLSGSKQKIAQSRRRAPRQPERLARGRAASRRSEAQVAAACASARSVIETMRSNRCASAAAGVSRSSRSATGWMKRWLASNTSASARRRSAMAKAPEATPSSTTRCISDCTRARCLRAAGALLGQRVDQQVEQRGVGVEFGAIGAVDGEQHPLELVVGGVGAVGGLAQLRLQRPQPGGGDLLEQRRLRGEIAIDIGVRHAGVRRDADDGGARRAEAAHMVGGERERAGSRPARAPRDARRSCGQRGEHAFRAAGRRRNRRG